MTDFVEDISVRFHHYDHDAAYGYYAHVRCSVCNKWNIAILPESKRNPEDKDYRDHRPLSKVLELLVPILEHPVCNRCEVGIKINEERKSLEKLKK